MKIETALNSLYHMIGAEKPIDVVAQVSSSAAISVSASGSNLAYQWQYSSNFGKTWANTTLSGAKTSTLTVTATAARNNYQYRCVITYGSKTWTSSAYRLVVLS